MSVDQFSALARLQGKNQVSCILTNEIKYVPFVKQPAPGRISAAGIYGLSVCSVVIIAAKRGAIVAHIGPNDGEPNGPNNSYIKHAERMMRNVRELYKTNQAVFDEHRRCFVIVATLNGVVFAPEQYGIMVKDLRNMSLEPIRVARQILPPALPGGREGTAVVLGGPDGVTIMLEDEIITHGLVPNSKHTYAIDPSATYPTQQASSTTQEAGSSQQAPRWIVKDEDTRVYLEVSANKTVTRHSMPPRMTFIEQINKNGQRYGYVRFTGEKWETLDEVRARDNLSQVGASSTTTHAGSNQEAGTATNAGSDQEANTWFTKDKAPGVYSRFMDDGTLKDYSAPPLHTWIRRVNAENKGYGWARTDGKDWQLRVDQP